MRVLVLSLNAWNLSNSTGNTISNLFSELDKKDDIANIYCRNEAIDNTICKKYFKITEEDILRSILVPNKCGNVVDYNSREGVNKSSEQVISKSERLKKYRSTSLLLIRELIWDIPVWKNKKLKDFVCGFEPDIIYMHGHYNLYMHKVLDFCQEVSGAKVVMYWGDDMYGRKSKAPLSFFYESLLRKRFRKSIDLSSLLFGGSLQLCREYTRIFGKEFSPFFKECKHIRFEEKSCMGNTISIVYAGNLLYGRESIMVDFVKALKNANKKGLLHHFVLKIYSNTIPSTESLLFLDDKKNSHFMGCKPYSQVCDEMDKSELALFIESFDKKNILSTRLSFSTKIIDCMQSTAGILAIGPKELASIDYISKNSLGYTITSVGDIETKMVFLAEHPEEINLMNKKKVEFAKIYHTNTSAKALAEIRRLI